MIGIGKHSGGIIGYMFIEENISYITCCDAPVQETLVESVDIDAPETLW